MQDYPVVEKCAEEMVLRNPTIRDQLQRKKQKLEEEIVSVNQALAALDSNPGFEEVHNAIVRAHIGGLR